MTGTAIIYIIISLLSLILGITNNDPKQIQNSTQTIEKIIERNKDDIQKNEQSETNATDIRP